MAKYIDESIQRDSYGDWKDIELKDKPIYKSAKDIFNSKFKELYDPLENFILLFRRKPRLIAEMIKINMESAAESIEKIELKWTIDELVHLADQPFISHEDGCSGSSNYLNINILRALKIIIDR